MASFSHKIYIVWATRQNEDSHELTATCLVCIDGIYQRLALCPRHENSQIHQANVAHQRQKPPTPEPTANASTTDPFDGALRHLLYTLSHPSGVLPPDSTPRPPSPPCLSGFDWNLYEIHENEGLELSAEHQAVSEITQALYSQFDDISDISDEEEQWECSEDGIEKDEVREPLYNGKFLPNSIRTMLLIYLDIGYQLGCSRTATQAGSNGGS